MILRYFGTLEPRKAVLWSYLVWYLATVTQHFSARPGIWLNSLGIALVVGIGLSLSVASRGQARPDRWQSFRLFLIPFCVSSFSALIKDQGFVVIFPPSILEVAINCAAVVAFLAAVALLKRVVRG